MMKLLFLAIIGLILIWANHANGQQCRRPKIPQKVPKNSYIREGHMNHIAKLLYESWRRPYGKPWVTDRKQTQRRPCYWPYCNHYDRQGRDLSHVDNIIKRDVPEIKTQSKATDHIQERTKRQTHIRRKEYRQMTVSEMDRFHRCMNAMKRNSDYDWFTRQHSFERAPSAHLGAAFPPWHRHFINLFEDDMRRIPNCRGVYLPYWDCTLDQRLPSPHHAVQWQGRFWGNNNGEVTSGAFGARWSIISDCTVTGNRLRREVNTTGMDFCSRQNILDVLVPKTYAQLMAFGQGRNMSDFELAHGGIHCYVGNCGQDAGPAGCAGHLGCVDCSPSDPIFYLLHSFVDCLWYEWASLPGRSNAYPTRNVPGGRSHGPNSPMRPFRGLTNRDGVSARWYTRCIPRPGRAGFSCKTDRDCNSPQGLLFCTKNCECRSKVREGGNCRGMPDKACYCRNGRGRCANNKCSCGY